MAAGAPERSLEQELRELRTINQLIGTLTSTLELPEILRIVLGRLKSLTQAEALSLMLYDAERDELVFAATETLRENDVVGLRLPRSRSLASWVARSGESAIVNDVESDPRFYVEIDRASGFRTRSLLCVPLRRAGQVVGVIEVANRYDAVPFDEANRRLLEGLAAEVGDACDPDSLCHDPPAMRQILARAVTLVPSEAASLLLVDPAGRELVFRASRAMQPGVIDGLRLPSDRGIAGLGGAPSRGGAARRRRRRPSALHRRGATDGPRAAHHDLRTDGEQGDAARRDPDHQQGRRLQLHGGGAATGANARGSGGHRDRERLALPASVSGLDHRRPHRARQHAPFQREPREADRAPRPRSRSSSSTSTTSRPWWTATVTSSARARSRRSDA